MCLIFLWTTILRVPCTRQMWEHNLDWNNSVEPMVETALFIVGGFSLWSWCDIYYFSSHNNHFTTIFSAFFCSFFRYHFRPFIHWRWAHFEHIHISEIESRKMATNMTTGYLVINDCPIIVSRQQSQTYTNLDGFWNDEESPELFFRVFPCLHRNEESLRIWRTDPFSESILIKWLVSTQHYNVGMQKKRPKWIRNESSGIGTENNQHKQKEAERVNRENAWHAGGAFGVLMPTTSIIQCFFTEFRIQHERSTIHNHTLNSTENERDWKCLFVSVSTHTHLILGMNTSPLLCT